MGRLGGLRSAACTTLLRPVVLLQALAHPRTHPPAHAPNSQDNLLWDRLTAREHLLFYGRLKNLAGEELRAAVDAALQSVNLFHGGVGDKQVGWGLARGGLPAASIRRCRLLSRCLLWPTLATSLPPPPPPTPPHPTPPLPRQVRKYSGGMRRRLSVAVSFIGDPLVVYLDEPSTGGSAGGRVGGRGCRPVEGEGGRAARLGGGAPAYAPRTGGPLLARTWAAWQLRGAQEAGVQAAAAALHCQPSRPPAP